MVNLNQSGGKRELVNGQFHSSDLFVVRYHLFSQSHGITIECLGNDVYNITTFGI